MTDTPTPRRRVPPQPPAPQQEAHTGTILTRRVRYGDQQATVEQGQEQTIEEVRVPLFPTAPARVRVGGSITQNLGDYNSTKVEVSIEMPCLPVQSEVQATYEALSQDVDAMLRRELALATGTGDQPQQPPPTPYTAH